MRSGVAAVLAFALLLLTLYSSVASAHVTFTVVRSVATNAAGGHSVYPGSRGVEYTVTVRYDGNETLEDVYACLELPAGITPVDTPCSIALDTEGNVKTIVEPGDVLVFRYRLDISRSLTPGWRSITVDMRYRVYRIIVRGEEGSARLLAGIYISSYPRPSLSVVDAYWEPGCYPGTSSARLTLVVYNSGVRILGGHGIARLDESVFTPAVVRFEVPGVGEERYARLTLPPVSVNASAEPGAYTVTLSLNVTAVTEDGVDYRARVEIEARVTVDQPPLVNVSLVDYGFEGLVSPGSSPATLYATISNREPGVTLEAVYARIYPLEGLALEGSGFAAASTPVEYGGFLTLRFTGVKLEAGHAEALLVVEALVSRNGAEYWVKKGYTLVIDSNPPPLDLRLLNASWFGPAYPGSEGLEYHVWLALLDQRRLRGGVATLEVPGCIHPGRLVVSVQPVSTGDVLHLVFRGLSVDPRCEPGVYEARLTLRLVAEGGSAVNVSVGLSVPMRVDSVGGPPFTVTSVEWSDGVAYGGASGAGIRVEMLVDEPGWRLEALQARLVLPEWLSAHDGLHVLNETLSVDAGYGETVTLEFSDITVSRGAPPRLPVYIYIRALVSMNGAAAWVEYSRVAVLEVKRAVLNASIVAYWWSSGGVGKGPARLTLLLESNSIHPLEGLTVRWSASGGVSIPGGGGASLVAERLEYGDRVTVESPTLYLTSRGVLNVCLDAVMLVGSERVPVSKCVGLSVEPLPPQGGLRLEGVEILCDSEPCVLAEGARGVTLRLILRNTHEARVAGVYATLSTSAALLEAVRGDCTTGVAPGATCSLDLVLNVTSGPGVYPALVTLTYAVERGAGYSLVSTSYNLTLRVSPLDSLAPRLVVAAAYWGQPRAPRLPYEQSGLTQVTLVIANRGRWEAYGVTVELVDASPGVEPVYASSFCASTLPPGSSCTATLWVRLGSVASSSVRLGVRVAQHVRVYGVNGLHASTYNVWLPVARMEWSGLRLLEVRWANDWPVYPNTSRARLELVFANLWPFALNGVMVRVEGPPGIDAESVYVEGPVEPYTSFTVQVPVDVGPVVPGVYHVNISVEYLVATSGAPLREEQWWSKPLRVSDPSRAITILGLWWEGSAAEPGILGLRLTLLARNDEVPEMKGVVVRLYLPPGFRSAADNSSVVVAAVEALPPVEAAGLRRLDAATLARLLGVRGGGRQGGGSVGAAVVPKGGFIRATTRVNIYRAVTGVYHIGVEIDFIDQWGSRHVYRGEASLLVQGASKLVQVYAPSVVNVTGGVGTLNITIVNMGEGPIYNVYVTIVPRLPLILPATSTFYVERLDPGRPYSLETRVYYNPAGLSYWSGQSNSRYASVPLIISVVYRDAAGYIHAFNATRPVQLLPFIELVLGPDARAEYKRGVLLVGGSIVNQGTATARNVEVRVEAGGATGSAFIGDVEPGDQAAFRVDVPLPTAPREARLYVVYMDEYGRVYEKSYVLHVTVVNETLAAPVEERAATQPLRHIGVYAVAIAVPVSLAVYMLLRRRLASPGGEAA